MANLEKRITEELIEDAIIDVEWSALSLLISNAPVQHQRRAIAAIRSRNKQAIGAVIYDLLVAHLRAIAASQARDIVDSGVVSVDLASKIAKEV